MLEGTIKLHGEQGCGKTQLLREVEKVLQSGPVLAEAPLRIVCKTQLPGQPEQVEVTFIRKAPGAKLQANWSRG